MERVQWVINRLRTMGPMELLSRLGDVGRHGVVYSTLQGVQRRAQRQSKSTDCQLRTPKFDGYLGRGDRAAQNRIMADASQWLNHRASFFALRDTPLGDPINWHCDYSSGVIGPLQYSGLINYRDATVVGDVKYIWELNRLQHLVLLALAFVWTGNNTYKAAITAQTLSWCAQNPFMRGLNWKSPLEAGMRLISWAFVSFLIGGLPQVEGVCHTALRETIYLHQYFIRKFYAKGSSANNHLLGEMAGLYVGAVFWPWYRESHVWRSFARRKLIQEMARQVEDDGVGKERATEYQLFILEFLLLAGALGHAIGEPFPKAYWERLGRMLMFLSAISDRAGNLPMFGDGDSGKAVWLSETLCERTRALVQLGQLSYRTTVGGATESWRSLLTLWGQTPAEVPLASVPKPEQDLQRFPQGGYYVLATNRGGDNEMMVVFDAGPLGFAPLYAHGHADALSFWLSYGGNEFLIDPGTFCYYTNPVWRAYFRGTAAHNTVRIDGEDQSVASGRFLWHRAAQCQATHVEDHGTFIAAEGFHNGYGRLADPVMHWRSMRLHKKSRTLEITDRLECQRSHDVEVFFHFAETCQVRRVCSGSFAASTGDKRLIVRLDSQLKGELYRGSENPISGWISRTFDVKEPSYTIVAHTRITGSTQFHTEIVAI